MLAKISAAYQRAVILTFLLLLCAIFTSCTGCGGGASTSNGGSMPPNSIPKTGPDVPGVAAYDSVITNLMVKWNIPGVAVAVTKDGRLILARGYGYADKENKILVQPDMLFRIASISKPITSATVLRLIEQGKLHLDDKFLDIIGSDYPLPPNADPRLRNVTIRNLLQHAGGWDRESTGYDPMGDAGHIATALGVPLPAICSDIMRYMFARPLDFDPGAKYVYSNFGYCILGRVIEKVIGTGENYETYVQNNVLATMDIHAMRIGHSLLSGRANNEVKYYEMAGNGQAPSVFPGGSNVPAPYGSFSIEAMDSHGGWIASPIDLTRFISALDGHRSPAFLTPGSMAQMTARPNLPNWTNTDNWYGLGISVRPVSPDYNLWHGGLLPGTSTLLVRAANGYCWAILTNFSAPDTGTFGGEMDVAMWNALGNGLAGSSTDLFSQYPSPTP